MMTTISRENAREIVDKIRENNGGISEADRANTPAGLRFRYINQAYIEAVPSHVLRCRTSWDNWLKRSDVRRAPRLVRWSTPVTLSISFDYILKWRSEDLVGILKAHWVFYKRMDELEPRPVIDALREAAPHASQTLIPG